MDHNTNITIDALMRDLNLYPASDELAQRKLNSLIQHRTPVLDASALFSHHFPAFVAHAEPLLKRYGKKLLLDSSALRELRNLQDTARTPKQLQKLDRLLPLMDRLLEEGLVEFRSCDSANGEDGLISLVEQLLSTQSVLLLCQKNSRSRLAMFAFRNLTGSHGALAVGLLNRYGYTTRFREDMEPSHRPVDSSSTSQPDLQAQTEENTLDRQEAPQSNRNSGSFAPHLPTWREILLRNAG